MPIFLFLVFQFLIYLMSVFNYYYFFAFYFPLVSWIFSNLILQYDYIFVFTISVYFIFF